MQVIVTIPAHNEERTVGRVIQEVRTALEHGGYNLNVLVVCDNCTDRTMEVALDNGAMVYLSDRASQGLAETFRLEMRVALGLNGDCIAHIDADGQYSGWDLLKLVQKYEEGYDLVLGSRLTGKIEHMRADKWLSNKVQTWIMTLALRRRILDVCTGLRVFSLDVAKIPINSRYTYTQEQLVKAVRMGYKIKYVPIYFATRKEGSSRLISGPFNYVYRTTKDYARILTGG